ncbi:elongation factor P hydroxylase [Gilvimarinus sp. F26214L]|uniref:elongation factor P hydroxylase n=1 Tax=Gilvimarinus sp. DZF01 TaxID=3461371 RepID=UPI0040467900
MISVQSIKCHQADTLVRIFNQLFAESHRVRLEGGAREPLYRPAESSDGWNYIIFTRDYFASALHEVAHWCIAGPERRKQLDYGYWYSPDGRDAQQQRAFEQVEVKPQALEWVFSRAAAYPFRLSADNLDGSAGPSDTFQRAVWQQARRYAGGALPGRAARFARALADHFRSSGAFAPDAYRLEDLR